MVFSSVPVYLDPPHHNWQQQQLPNHHQSGGGESDNNHFPPPLPPPPSGGSGGTATGSTRPGSMAERARLAKMPQPEVALKCPRCESTNTKFCYFNNYSLTQPRHFCKTCRRYWTRGGALRSVPVGGGCRRNKKSKRNRSKSPAMNDHRRDASSSAAGVTSTTTCTTGMIGHLILPPPQQLPFLPSLPHLSDYSSTDISLNFPGIQPPVAATGGVNGGIDMEFGIGTNTGGGGGGGSILSARFAEQWRLQQVQQFPFLTGLDIPSGLYPFEGEGVVDPSGFTGSASTGHLGSKGSGGLTQVATSVKIEDNRGVNLSRNFLGIPGNDHYWGGNAWTDLSGFTSSSTSHLFL
ncbi:unnamed protein product [Camellia sinensis]